MGLSARFGENTHLWARLSRKPCPRYSAGILSGYRYLIPLVLREVDGMRSFDDVLRLRHLCSRPMDDQEKLICLECCLVLHNAVLGNSYAVEASSQSTQRSYLHRD